MLLPLGHAPYWGLSSLLNLRDGEQILFVPELEPKDVPVPSALPGGVTEAQEALAAESEIHGLTGRDGIRSAGPWAMVQSGPTQPLLEASTVVWGRRIEEGDLVLIELATCVNSYWSDLTRTEAIGDIRPQRQDLLSAVGEAQKAAQRLGYIHFRNVTGKVPHYTETFIDDGDMDMLRAISILHRNGFDGVMIPDHTPQITCSAPWHAGMAHTLGFMRGALASLESAPAAVTAYCA